jgi:Uma2 family endonuclease
MPATAILTSEQYLSLPEAFDQNGNRIKDELIGGEVVKMPPASHRHDRIKNRIKRLLDRHLDRNPQLAVESLVEMGAEVSGYDVFIPDVSIVKLDRCSEEDRVFRGAPDLAIEVVSPSDTPRRLKAKVDTYLLGGSETVWVVFPDSRSVMVYSPGSVHEPEGDQSIEHPLLRGFSTKVSEFFEPA